MNLHYKTFLDGNKRHITAVMPKEMVLKVERMGHANKYNYGFIDLRSLKEIEFHYFRAKDDSACYVEFTMHRLVNAAVVDMLVFAAEKLLRGMK